MKTANQLESLMFGKFYTKSEFKDGHIIVSAHLSPMSVITDEMMRHYWKKILKRSCLPAVIPK